MDAGSRLGPYEIIAPIGAGGMGEVYRAVDTRLARTVAIKVLPAHLAADAERRQRLDREARIVSSLDHPNICALYDVGHEAGRDFLVMQYLDGETLAERLAKGQLAIDRALSYSVEIASALDAAHRAGIVHRDLKPANVMLTKSGTKVLDFGLARLAAPATGGPLVDALTVTSAGDSHPMTADGVILGTVPYMAPEQVEGKATDGRTDIFALGAVMFEMLTGRRAFAEPSAARTMTAILQSDPPPVSSIRPGVSAAVDRVVRKCLVKDPDLRWQTARDLADEMQWLRGDAGITAGPTSLSERPKRQTRIAVALGLLAIAAMLATPLLIREPAPLTFSRITFQRGTISNARFSPDGHTIVYTALWDGKPADLFMTAGGSPESRSLGLPGLDLLDVSSSGELAMLRPGGILAVAPLTGARAPHDVADKVIAAAWGPQGARLAAVRAWDPQRSFTPLEYPLGQTFGHSPWTGSAQRIRMAPDGSSVVISETPLIAQATRLTLVQTNGGVRDLGTWSSITGYSYAPGGGEIWVSGERDGSGPVLWAVSLGGQARVLARFPGEPVLHDVAGDGRALISMVERRLHMTAVIDGREHDLSWMSASGVRGITDDGRTIAFEDVSDRPGAARSTWIRTTDGAPAMRLGEGRPLDIAPRGDLVASTITGPPAKLVLYPAGPGDERVVAEGAYDYPAASFLPNGEKLLFVETPSAGRVETPFTLKLADVRSGTITPLTSDLGAVHVRHAISPDGRSVLLKRQGGAFFSCRSRRNDGTGMMPRRSPVSENQTSSGDGHRMGYT